MRILLTIIFILPFYLFSQSSYQIAILKYNGGGDWYANPTALKNIIKFSNQNIGTNIITDAATVEVGSSEIFNYPFLHMTGHGSVVFSNSEAINLRNYLLAGGFLHIDDNYGMDPFVRKEIKKVFPEASFKKLQQTTLSLMENINLRMVYQKFMNMMQILHRHLALL